MTLLNAALTRVADVVLAPLAGLPPILVILGAALASALIVLLIMRVTSNQAAVAAVKRRIHASLLEMRLYNDDLRALLRAQRDVLRHNLAYVGHSLVPLVVSAVPLMLAIAQLQAWYGYVGLPLGEPTVITAEVRNDGAGSLAALEAEGWEQLGPPRYFPTLGQIAWRVVPRHPGAHTLRVSAAGGTVEKSAFVEPAAGSTTTARRSPAREGPSFVGQLLYPSEAPLDDAGVVRAIRLPYADRALTIAGLAMHWLVWYVAATFAFVLLLRKPLGVVI
jgi:uncharacterized membrane protein (DUF106 family)